MSKYAPIFLLLLISLTQGEIRRSRRGKHGEDCVSDAACDEGFFCQTYRCFTEYEARHMDELGLEDKNVCDEKKKCSREQTCYKHRCIDSLLVKDAQKQQSVNPEDEIDVSMVFSGSINLNKLPYLSGFQNDNSFNYDHFFTHVKNFIKHADISVALQETPFYINPSEKKIKLNYKNTPKELGDAIANAGFNTVLHATQDSYSKLDAGIVNTLAYWKNEHPNVKVLGISKTDKCENDYYIYEIKGVKIAIIDFASYLTKELPKSKKHMVNILSEEKVEEIMDKIKNKADLYVACVDWGIKSERRLTKKQLIYSKLLIEHGVNLIIGNHPDYVQPVSYVRSKNGNCGLVFFSLGLFIGEGKNSFGALAHIVVSKGKEKAYISSYSLRPVINHKIQSNQYTVFRLSEYSQELASIVNKKIKVHKLRKICKKLIGAFAYC
jgi:poly-gamma-glutamate synthesis protein (capsule biosynthesis protein)